MAAGIQKLVNAQVSTLVQQQLQTALAPLQQQQQLSAEQAHFQEIFTTHPDAESIVESKEFGDWITEQRKINPLIGKSYIEAAHEYHSEQIKMNDESTLINSDAENFIKHETNKAFDVEESHKIMSDVKDGDNHDIKFIDMSIIENTTSKMLSYDKEEIIKVANEELKKYHNDKNYETEIDSNSVINTTQQFLLTQGNNTKLLK